MLEHLYSRKGGVLFGVPQGMPGLRCPDLSRRQRYAEVPHPGLDHLRCTYPCSHGMNAQRIRLPPGKVSAQIDMDNVYMTL